MDLVGAAIISAELDFLGSLQYNEALYKVGDISKTDYVKSIKEEKAKKEAILEKINKKLNEEIDAKMIEQQIKAMFSR